MLKVKILLMVPSPALRSFTATATSGHSLKQRCTLLWISKSVWDRWLSLPFIKVYAPSSSRHKMTVENKVGSLTCLISSQLGFSATAEIDDLEASILNRQGKEQIILASQPRLVPKKTVKQLQNVPVPQADLREPTISVRAAIIANFQLLKIGNDRTRNFLPNPNLRFLFAEPNRTFVLMI